MALRDRLPGSGFRWSRILLLGTLVWANPLAADCAALLDGEARITLTGTTQPGIKNRVATEITIELEPVPANGHVGMTAVRVTSDGLTGGSRTWRHPEPTAWGNACLPMSGDSEVAPLLVLSWEATWRHPNLHGTLQVDDGGLVFRGFIDNSEQDFHEAAVVLRSIDAR